MYNVPASVFGAFEAEETEKYLTELSNFLCDVVPSLAEETQDNMARSLKYILDRARGYGIVSEQGIAKYAISAGILGLNFDTDFPGAGQILRDKMMEQDKVELLENFTLNLLEILER